MAVSSVRVSSSITDRIGGPGVRAIADWLWPVDCQTCGQPLGTAEPSLCVDDLMTFGAASLHHQDCRPPEWNEGRVLSPGAGLITHRTRLFLMPLTKGAEDRPLPALLVNPGMEYVLIRRDDGWRPGFDAVFAHAGLHAPGPDLVIDKPVRGASALATEGGVSVFVHGPSATESYTCGFAGAEDPIRLEAEYHQGIMLAVSHVVDPHDPDPGPQIENAVRSGRILFGWVPFTREGRQQ